MFSYGCWLKRGMLLSTLAWIIHKNFPLYWYLPIVLISNGTNCWPYCLTTRPTGLLLFVKCTNCGWGHLLSRLNERDGLSGGAGTGGAVSHIPLYSDYFESGTCGLSMKWMQHTNRTNAIRNRLLSAHDACKPNQTNNQSIFHPAGSFFMSSWLVHN